ncbi:MAG TPA: L-fucose:H+ symporter permease [Cyclobacteriaceae bacterium]|nr:L-fucose:H+ symporter permease [Cyclobacteriaceae bacterium]
MAFVPSEVKTTASPGNRSYVLAFILVTSLFFLWGLANSLNGTLIKHFQTALNLNRAQAGIVDSAFYIGYFVMALPAAFLMNRIGYKKGILIGLFLYVLGAVLFYPAAEVRVYGFFLFGLFVIACGLAFLETAANPYVTVLGDPAGAERRINFSQSFNGTSIILGPVIGSLFIFSDVEYTNEMLNAMEPAKAEAIRIAEAHSVQGPYLVLAGVVLFVAILTALVKMPEISDPSEKQATFKGITRHRHLMYGVIAQFFYVGAQASVWAYYVDLKLHFAADQQFGIVAAIYRFHESMTPTQMASFHASFAFVMFMIGRFAGTWLLTKFAANKLLSVYAGVSALLMIFAYFTDGLAAVTAITLSYFFMSIMFPTIFALSIKNLGEQVKIGSGLVIMAIVGGAVLPPITGYFSLFGIENALLVPLIAFIVILFFGVKGYKVKSA